MEEIQLLDKHGPNLESGDYEISISQKLQVNDISFNVPDHHIKIIIESEKYTINQLQIDSVFPPAGSVGDFSLTFPHIVFNRSTLPWERQAKPDSTAIPWLALIIFSEDEIGDQVPDLKKAFVKNISKREWESHIFPNRAEEFKPAGDGKEELISILIGDNSFLTGSVLPNFTELQYLSHVRKTVESEKSVVVCNRLPKKNKRNIVHLVSLEHLLHGGEFIGNNNIAVATLKSWEFFCNDHFLISKEALEIYEKHLDKDATDLRNALSRMTGKEYFNKDDLKKALGDEIAGRYEKTELETIFKSFTVGHLSDVLKHLDREPGTLRPKGKDEFLRQGFLSLPYILKTRKKIEALYRGPFVPVSVSRGDTSVLINADEAIRYLSDFKKIDISYAAAWELGRLLSLQNRNFSVALYQWKRSCYQAIKMRKPVSEEEYEPPSIVKSWFKGIATDLKAIPINYLIPDASLIPFESIRFFAIDPNWLKHLVDGAFSIARISKKEVDFDVKLYEEFKFLELPTMARSGFILHSVAVAGWPDLVIDCDNLNKTDFVTMRKEKLSPNLLICLFNDDLSSVSIYQRAHTVHFALENDDAASNFGRMGDQIQTYKSSEGSDKTVAGFVKTLLAKIEISTFSLNKFTDNPVIGGF